ncbi:hypothetical protein LS178_001568 [Salmonella enterica]|nr:hypothetical protein [Salmonella enterica]
MTIDKQALRKAAEKAGKDDPAWWKPKGARSDLVRAGALIQAEIERIDRAAGIGVRGNNVQNDT